MRRKLAISILTLVFGLLLGHQVIPHHHHDEMVGQVHAVGHDHDGEGEHHHHLLDLFFSVLHHVDESTSVYVHRSVDGRTSDKLIPSLFAVCSTQIDADRIDSGTSLLRNTVNPISFSLHQTIPSLRGPPLT